MILLDKYNIIENICNGPGFKIFSGSIIASNQRVIISCCATEHISHQEQDDFHHICHLLEQSVSDHIVRFYAKETLAQDASDILSGSDIMVVYEDPAGVSLKEYLITLQMDITKLLNLSIQICAGLQEVHKLGIIHKCLTPETIFIDPEKRAIKLSGFGPFVLNEHPIKACTGSNGLGHQQKMLPYISPEHTGRTDHPVDFRSDLYSLGTVMYEMLTGHPPFVSDDPLALIHCHMAKDPICPHDLFSEIPDTLSHIIMKLLLKASDDRYQNAMGLMADLKECRNQIKDFGIIKPFPIAKHDVSGRLRISKKLYGRQKEVDILKEVYGRICKGYTEMVLINGHPGIGKTFLVEAYIKSISGQQGYIISGKCDQYNPNLPYSPFVQAFENLITQILVKEEKSILKWKNKILEGVGENVPIITEIIPMLELIVGTTAPIVQLSPEETQNRFNHTFRNFIKIFTDVNHPFVLFLDDLQWANTTTLSLLKNIITDDDLKGFFLIGVCRDNEVDKLDPLMDQVNQLRERGLIREIINLGRLESKAVNLMLADSFGLKPDETMGMANLVETKTGSNPFFIREFVLNLYKDHLISFDNRWNFNIEQIVQADISDNVVALMTHRVRKLPAFIQNILKIASCIGREFVIEDLSKVSGISIQKIMESLEDQIEAGIFIRRNRMLQFSHDKMHEAIYTLLNHQERARMHHDIGIMFLLKAKKKSDDSIFKIVQQLNRATHLISDKEKKQELAELNLNAGMKAKKSAAYELAYQYFTTGIDLLAPDSWDTEYELTLSLYTEAGEAGFIADANQHAEECLDIVLEKARTIFDKIRAYEIRIANLTASLRPLEAIQVGRVALKILGVRIPTKVNPLFVFKEIALAKRYLKGRRAEELVNLPELTDPQKTTISRLLMAIAAPSYIGYPDLLPLVLLKLLNFSLKYGNTEHSPYAYVFYGLMRCGHFRDIENGYGFGKLALNVLKNLDAKALESKVNMIFGSMISHWKMHYKNDVAYLIKGYESGIKNGDLVFASYSINQYLGLLFGLGKNLDDVIAIFNDYWKRMQNLQQVRSIQLFRMMQQLAVNLRGDAENCWNITGNYFDEKDIEKWEQANDYMCLGVFFVFKVMLCFIHEGFKESIHAAKKSTPYLGSVAGMILDSKYNFYYSLSMTAHYHQVERKEKRELLKQIKTNQKKMKIWALHAPENFKHRYFLIEAEMAGLLGKNKKAMELYDKAIKLASANGFIHIEAIANECAAKLFLNNEKYTIAKVYITEAHRCYQKWGALAKVNLIEETYPNFFTDNDLKPDVPTRPDNTSGTSLAEHMDMTSIIKATQAISGETVLSRLMDKLMKIVIENAGARKGFLILKKDEILVVDARVSAGDEAINDFHPLPLEQCRDICKAIVLYVVRTGEDMVLGDAAVKGNFTANRYVMDRGLKSVLCIPIIHNSDITGALYLENNKISGVFTPKRVEILTAVTKILANAWAKNKAEEEVLNYQEQLRSLSSELLLTEERERRQIAVDLHDRIGHALADVMMKLGEIKGVADAHELAEPLEKITRIIDRTIEDTHSLTFDLSPPILYDLGLEAALDWLAEETRKQHGIEVVFKDDMEPKPMDETTRVLLFQSTRELLFNMVKHARATYAAISIKREGEDIKVLVEDNGVGFDPSDMGLNMNKKGGFGLFSIKERLNSQGGYLKIDSKPGKGTVMTMLMPVKK